MLPRGEPGSQSREWAGNTEIGLRMGAWGTRGGEGWTYSCKLCLSPTCMRRPLSFPNPNNPLQSSQRAGTGGETNLLLGCFRAHREPPGSHAHLLKYMAPVSDPVASLCPLMRHRSARFRPSSPRSLGCLVEGCTRGSGQGFLSRSAWRGCSLPCTSHTQEQFCGTWHSSPYA